MRPLSLVRMKRHLRLIGEGARSRTRAPADTGLILMYHRINDTPSDPWDLCVSPAHFAGHMEVLARLGLATTLMDLSTRLFGRGHGGNTHGSPGVAVTFDDGYVDNLHNALPVLERSGVPATLYVTSGAIGVDDAFWWDRLQRIFLETPRLPRQLSLDDGSGAQRSWDLADEAVLPEAALARLAAWRPDCDPARGPRQTLFLELWEVLAPLPAPLRHNALARLNDWAGAPIPDDDRPMTRSELTQMAAASTISIGGHTRNHVDLSRVPMDTAAREIAEDRAALRDMTGQPVDSFALPFGRAAAHTCAQIRAAGYSNATTSRLGLCDPSSDPLAMPRLQVSDMPAARFERLIRWLIRPAVAG